MQFLSYKEDKDSIKPLMSSDNGIEPPSDSTGFKNLEQASTMLSLLELRQKYDYKLSDHNKIQRFPQVFYGTPDVLTIS